MFMWAGKVLKAEPLLLGSTSTHSLEGGFGMGFWAIGAGMEAVIAISEAQYSRLASLHSSLARG